MSAKSSGFVLLIVAARTPTSGRHLHLVPHQREQRRDEERGSCAAIPEQARRDEVDGALAPSGPLHEEEPRPPDGDRLDRLHLERPRLRVGSDHRAEVGNDLGRVGLDSHDPSNATVLQRHPADRLLGCRRPCQGSRFVMPAVSPHVQRMPGFAGASESEHVDRDGVDSSRSHARLPVSMTFPRHAAIQSRDSRTYRRMVGTLSGPVGSACARKLAGSVSLNA